MVYTFSPDRNTMLSKIFPRFTPLTSGQPSMDNLIVYPNFFLLFWWYSHGKRLSEKYPTWNIRDKIRDASGERKYLITASNLTELTFSKDVLLKCSFNSFYTVL